MSYEIIENIHRFNQEIDEITGSTVVEQVKENKQRLEEEKKAKKKEKEDFFKNNLGLFPLFYSTPTGREYITMDGKYQTVITFDSDLYLLLKHNLMTNNIGYLGNSEGWVDLKFLEL